MIRKITISILLLVILSASLIGAGTYREGWQEKPDPIPFVVPPGWPKPTIQIFEKNRLTEQGFQLGRRLFYDSRLSRDGEISCASCHQPFASFATYDHDLSHGVSNALSTRNAPVLVNLAWMSSFHWDGGVNHIEVQPLHPLTSPTEMGIKLDSVLTILKSDSLYRRQFKAAFGDGTINSQRMLRALAQFTGSLVSYNSKYDRVKRGDDQFTDYEQRGYELYKSSCASCHPEPLFTDNSFRNNGLSLNRFRDIGRQGITNLPSDSLTFKVPTLRNTQVSFPYMHDGRLYTLYHVVEHYRSGIDTTQPTLDPLLKHRISMTTKQKNELVYFLYTLTDSSFLRNPRFAPVDYSGVATPDIHKKP